MKYFERRHSRLDYKVTSKTAPIKEYIFV